MSQKVRTVPEPGVPSFGAPSGAPIPWLRETAAVLREQMLLRGAVLVRGLPVHGPAGLAGVREALGITPHIPSEAFNGRRDHGNGILAPISWPADRPICPFQESSFSRTFPSVVLTACITPPDGGGRAHLGDARRTVERLPPQVADRVRRDGWTMTRTFHDGFGISWRDAFSVPDRAALDGVLDAAGIESRWLPGGSLHTVRRLPGVVAHPATGEECWFNQLSFLNAGSLDPVEREVMVKSFGEYLPMNTYHGDGSPPSQEDLSAIYDAYDSVKTGFQWRRGDLLITDNIIMAQGRSAYEGSPEFVVALGGEQHPDRSAGRRIRFDSLASQHPE